jgi:prepilin-type N-terminal cleavage/methylation domain-containing protein
MMRKYLGSPAEAGFTLIEVMIACAVMAIVGLGMLDLNLQSMKGGNDVRLVSEALGLKNLVSLVMMNGTACTANLQTSTHPSYTFNTNLTANSNQVIAIPSLLYPPPSNAQVAALNYSPALGLTVTKLELDNFQQLILGTNYTANLHIEATKSGAFLGSPITPMDIPVSLQTTTVGTTASITGCGSGGIPQILASVSFTSCALVGYGDTSHWCRQYKPWGTTLPNSNYSIFCGINPSTDPGAQIMYATMGGDTTGFTYYVSSIHDGDAGTVWPMNCIAVGQ